MPREAAFVTAASFFASVPTIALVIPISRATAIEPNSALRDE